MAKQNDAGVYKLKNGNWAYRYVLMVNGVRKEVRKAKDEFGASFKTKREAIKAREVLPKSWTKVMRQSHFEFCIGQDLTHSIFL